MSFWPFSKCLNIGFTVVLVQIFFVNSLTAVEPPKMGTQWLYGGLSISPSMLNDAKAPDRGLPETSIGLGVAGRLGLLHAVSETFYMRAEFDLGVSYFRPHTAHPDGAYRVDETAFSWQVGLGAQYIPMAAAGGPALGLNLNIFRASLEGGGLQTLAPEFRLGWYIWRGLDFALVEISYAYPALSGLNTPVTFDDADPVVPQTWSFHKFGIAITTSF